METFSYSLMADDSNDYYASEATQSAKPPGVAWMPLAPMLSVTAGTLTWFEYKDDVTYKTQWHIYSYVNAANIFTLIPFWFMGRPAMAAWLDFLMQGIEMGLAIYFNGVEVGASVSGANAVTSITCHAMAMGIDFVAIVGAMKFDWCANGWYCDDDEDSHYEDSYGDYATEAEEDSYYYATYNY